MNVNHAQQTEAGLHADTQPEPSRWKDILLFISGGILAATQIGKAHIALPNIEATLAQGLTGASWIISALSLMAVLCAVPAGVFASKLGLKRAVVFGLLLLSLCSLLGSFSRNESELLLSRVGEGLGYLAVIVSAPSIIAVIANQKHHLVALGAWGAFLPSGVAIGTVLGPYAMLNDGWRGLWLWSAASLFVASICIQLGTREAVSRPPVEDSSGAGLGVYSNRAILILGGIFGFYTLQHLGIMSLFPSYLIKVLHASPMQAGSLNSIAMALNIAGNVAAGILLRRGMQVYTLLPAALFMMLISAFVTFETHTIETHTITLAFAGACTFCAVGGAVPGSVLALLPSYSRSARELAPGNGLLVQGSNLGILVGPVLVSMLASTWGWSWTPAVSLLSFIGGIVLLFLLSRCSNKSL